MRLFVAIELPEMVRAALGNVQQQVRKQTIKGRFFTESNMHLTLCFLGETKPERVQELMLLLQEAAALGKAFPLHFARQLRYFGTEKPARVVWIGLHGELKPLRKLQLLLLVKLLKKLRSQQKAIQTLKVKTLRSKSLKPWIRVLVLLSMLVQKLQHSSKLKKATSCHL